MTRYYLYFLLCFLMLGSMFLVQSCTDSCEQTFVYTIYEPVYMTKEAFVAGARIESPRQVQHPGKIYIKDQYLFINEHGKGIHIIDNRNPAAPQALSFIAIPGTVDMAVKDQILYADSKMDFLAIDITDPTHPSIIKRLSNVFTYTQTYPGNWWVSSTMPPNLDTEKNVILDWVKKEEKRVEECSNMKTGWIQWRGGWAFASMEKSFAAPQSSTGIGGSMARFAVVKDFLYTVDNWQVRLFDVQNPAEPALKKEQHIGSGVETIFPYKNHLFFGTTTGMLIYSIANPENPTYVSQVSHFFGCDPVVVQDNYAYVTVKGGTSCRSKWDSQLEVIDISEISKPKTIKTYTMEDPNGVGIDGNTLFICDGKAGLKIFDASDKTTITEHLLHRKDIHAYDIIPYNKLAIMIGNDGLYQYDYTDPAKLKLLSVIPIQKQE